MGIVLLGVLSGMVFGAFGVLLRRFAVAVILTPVVAAPLMYLVAWRDALLGRCFFATNFNKESCAPFRDFLGTTLGLTPEMIMILVAHLATATFAFIAISIARKAIARADLTSPAEKEARREAAERAEQAQAALKEKMEEDLRQATIALEKSREIRKQAAAGQAT